MKMARIGMLVFRYGILVFLGISIAYLWKTTPLKDLETWRRFYALWIPIMYALFSTGYLAFLEYGLSKHSDSDTCHAFSALITRCFRYDDYTYFFPLWILGLEIAAPHLQNVLFWLSSVYLVIVILKIGLFLACLLGYFRQEIVQEKAQQRIPRHIQLLLTLIVFVAYSLISVYHIQRITTTGDEPHYLLITHSLWYDHDSNLYNNYNNRDYESMYWDELRPTWGDQVSETEIYSYRHKGGYPLTLIPGYVLGGRFGATLQTNLITTLLMLQIFLLSYELFHSLTASFAVWSCMAFTIPFFIYMGQIYPESLAALLAVWGVRRIRMFNEKHAWHSIHFWRNSVLIGFSLLFLIFLKTRYLPLAGTIGLFGIFHLLQGRLRFKHKLRAILGLIILLGLVVIIALLIDSLFFDNMFRDRITDTKYMAWMLGGYNPLFGFLGLLFDQEYGLFFYTPLYMLAFVGIGLLSRQEFRETFSVLGIFLLNYLVISFWPLWHAAPTPPSRYILPALPFLGVFLAKFFLQKGVFVKRVVFGVCAVWSFLAIWIVTLNPWWRYNWADGSNNFLENVSWRLSINLNRIFPSFSRLSPATPYLTLLGILGIGMVIWACRREDRESTIVYPQNLFREYHVLVVMVLFVSIVLGGLIIGKMAPNTLIEAEDTLDRETHGGERVPPKPDPWENQIYLREWKYYGWRLNPGDSITVYPILYHGLPLARPGRESKWDMQIYARGQLDKKHQKDFPVMQIVVNGNPAEEIQISSENWNMYTVTISTDERRPSVELLHQKNSDSQRSIIIDKLRFY